MTSHFSAMLVVSLITCLLLLLLASICSSNGNTSDDYLEHISVNAGEPATLICDLPEKYSNKRVSSQLIDHRRRANEHHQADYGISPGKYPSEEITMTQWIYSRRISTGPRDVYSSRRAAKTTTNRPVVTEHDSYSNIRT